jgi:CBS domain containing-hemolysin-like protein
MNDLVGRLLLIILLIALNAFFVTAEFSIMAVGRSRISQLRINQRGEEGDRSALAVQYLQRHLDTLLSTTQLGITLASLGLGWLGENTVSQGLALALEQLPLLPNYAHFLSHLIAIPLAFLLIAYLQIVLGELCPKAIAFLYTETIALFLAPPIKAIARLMNPFIWFLNHSTYWLLEFIGLENTDKGRDLERLTPEELQRLIATEEETIGLGNIERTILNNAFVLRNTTAAEIMVPRSQLIVLNANSTVADLLQATIAYGYSRYPLKGESLDDIRGIIDIKELAVPLLHGDLCPTSRLGAWMKPIRFVSENIPLTDLLASMQRSLKVNPGRSHLKTVMVVDEFGGTSGLITIEDLVTEILGAGEAEENEDRLPLQMLDPQTFIVEASMNLEELNEILGLGLPLADDYQTLGGFLLYEWQKIPHQGESLRYKNLTFTIEVVNGPRLEKVRIYQHFASLVSAR